MNTHEINVNSADRLLIKGLSFRGKARLCSGWDGMLQALCLMQTFEFGHSSGSKDYCIDYFSWES